jgi:serine/threonine-protein kinase
VFKGAHAANAKEAAMGDDFERRVRRLWESLLALPPEAQREALEQERARDPALGRALEGLLGHHRQTPLEGSPDGVPGPRGPEDRAPDFIGKYRVIRRLGIGGQAEVFRAEHPDLKVDVVVKWARADSPPEFRHRLRQEAEIAAGLNDPGVVRVLDAGADQGRPYVVFEYVDGGQSLAQRLERGRPSPRQAAGLVAEVAATLGRLHARGLLHRDIKPANILIDPSGRPKLIDFGLSALQQQWREIGPPEAGVPGGSPPYMAPEQARGEARRVGPRTDLFNLGATLYELLTGQPPYRGEDPAAVLDQARQGDVTPPRRLDPRVPKALERICLKALAKEPERRYASAGSLARALRFYLWRRPLLAAGLGAAGLVLAVAFTVLLGRALSPPPLVVRKLEVHHIARAGRFDEPRGVLGVRSFAAGRGDGVTVRGELSVPAYCYLIAYRPDGTDEVCFPEDAHTPPPRTDRPGYPSVRPEVSYGLEEGAGLMAFALVVSRRPLPAYAAWRRQRGVCPWREAAGPPNVVWLYDGHQLLAATPDNPGGLREKGRKRGDAGPLPELLDWLRQAPDVEVVAAVAFPVHPAEKP